MSTAGRIRWRELRPERAAEFVARGHRLRSFFPHRAVFLPRPGPDGAKLARRMCGAGDPASLFEVVLFADESMLAEFPRELFFDDDVVWHRQHLGRPGHVAYANVVLRGPEMWSMTHVSDLVQRIGRRREHKTRIENRFKGWPDMLLNALLAFAVERGVERLHLPTARLQMRHTDPARRVEPELFERVYDRSVARLLEATRVGAWWSVDVGANLDRLVPPTLREEALDLSGTICLCHDVEAGLGHVGIDEALRERADGNWRENVARMLRYERLAGVRATYNVVGRLLPEVKPEIEAGGHCVAFHSYDHAHAPEQPARGRRLGFLRRGAGPAPAVPAHEAVGGVPDQLAACRLVDYRIKGYRVPQSRLTAELSDENLAFHAFEWLGSSAVSLGLVQPELRNGLVRVPVHLDEIELYRGTLDLAEWKRRALATIAERGVAVLSLHDCYGHLWLDGYEELLEELGRLGDLRTVDDVAADVTLAAAL